MLLITGTVLCCHIIHVFVWLYDLLGSIMWCRWYCVFILWKSVNMLLVYGKGLISIICWQIFWKFFLFSFFLEIMYKWKMLMEKFLNKSLEIFFFLLDAFTSCEVWDRACCFLLIISSLYVDVNIKWLRERTFNHFLSTMKLEWSRSVLICNSEIPVQ